MAVKIEDRWLHLTVSFFMLTSCYSPSEAVNDTVTTFNGTTATTTTSTTEMTSIATTLATKIFLTLETTDFDYSTLNWSTREPTPATDEYGDVSTDYSDDGNRTDRIPTGGDRDNGLSESAQISMVFITAGVIIAVFALCYVCTMMNLCVCRFFMYECPSGRYREDPPIELEQSKTTV